MVASEDASAVFKFEPLATVFEAEDGELYEAEHNDAGVQPAEVAQAVADQRLVYERGRVYEIGLAQAQRLHDVGLGDYLDPRLSTVDDHIEELWSLYDALLVRVEEQQERVRVLEDTVLQVEGASNA